jgi:hypothetical protein
MESRSARSRSVSARNRQRGRLIIGMADGGSASAVVRRAYAKQIVAAARGRAAGIPGRRASESAALSAALRGALRRELSAHAIKEYAAAALARGEASGGGRKRQLLK